MIPSIPNKSYFYNKLSEKKRESVMLTKGPVHSPRNLCRAENISKKKNKPT